MKTNLDKIREIDSDGLAYFLSGISDEYNLPWCRGVVCEGDCIKCCEKWLWKEVDEDVFD